VNRHRVVLLAAFAASLGAMAGCTGSDGIDATDDPATPGPTATGPSNFDPALDTELFLPATDRESTSTPVPLVVIVPGGGWVSADPEGLVPLAEDLSDRGAAASTVTYRTAPDGAYFPLPVQDIVCDIAYVAAQIKDQGVEVSEVVLVGHSAGAQLAALVALGQDGDAECSEPLVPVDRFVGVAGPYDVSQASPAALLFGPERSTTDEWVEGNPLTYADSRPEVPVLLVHGREDAVVPLAFTEQFAAALEAGGHDVTTRYVDGADHQSIYAATVVGPLLAEWLDLS